MATTKDTASFVVLESFIGRIGNVERMFRKGDDVRPTDPAVRKWPSMFGPRRFADELPVEQATAGPGEKRGA